MAEPLVWIDCEMTGLDPVTDALVEIAVVITDMDLDPLDPGLDIVIATEPGKLATMDEVVREMHTASGLLPEIRASGTSVAEAETQVLEYIQQFVPERRKAPLCGNSIATDRAFIARHMSALDDYLHYRMIDVSSVKELARRWYPRIYFNAPAKHGGHRALADILESITELRYYRDTMFVDQPGPTTEQTRAAAARYAAPTAAADVEPAEPLAAGATPPEPTSSS